MFTIDPDMWMTVCNDRCPGYDQLLINGRAFGLDISSAYLNAELSIETKRVMVESIQEGD